MEPFRQLRAQISRQIPENHIPKSPLYPYAKYQTQNLSPLSPKPIFPKSLAQNPEKHLPPEIPVIPQPKIPKTPFPINPRYFLA